MKFWDGIIDVNEIPAISPPKKQDIWIMRGLIGVGLITMTVFVVWFFKERHIGNPFLFWALAIAIGFKLLRTLHEWYHYAGVSVPERPESTREWTVDMFTTFVPGEPYSMIVETLTAMVKVRYPHTTYLCDEGNDPYLKQICEELGVIHVYRGTNKSNAKAGNINYALKQATGEIAVVLDPDHVPAEEFLHQVLPYFEQEDIGYVQSVQAYHNRDESFIAKGAAEQTYHFYGPMMMSMNTYGTVQAIGANCAFRRSALDSIGGHAAGLSEDMHTAMQLHAKGWKSTYVPEALTRGQVPATLSAYYQQQLKWTRGSLDLLFHTVPKLVRNFTWRQALHYFTLPLYFLFGLIALIDLSIPIISLFTSEVPWLVEMDLLLQYSLPLLAIILVIRQFAQRWLLEPHERGMHVLGGTLMLGTWWIFLIGFIYTVIDKKVPYIPTPKNDDPKNELRLSIPNIAVMIISLAAIAYGLSRDWSPYMLMMAAFAMSNVLMLGLVVLMSQQKTMMKAYQALYGGAFNPLRVNWYVFRQRFIYQPLGSAYMGLAVVLLITLGVTALPALTKFDPEDLKPPRIKESEGRYVGLGSAEKIGDISSQLISIDLPPDPATWATIPTQTTSLPVRIPLVSWKPWETDSLPNGQWASYQSIAEGNWDEVFLQGFEALNSLGLPVYVVFAPDPDRMRKGWTELPENAPKYYLLAWQHLRSMAQAEGLYQLVWFQQVFGNEAMSRYLSKGKYADVIALSGAASAPDEVSFEGRLQIFHRLFGQDPTWIMDLQPGKDAELVVAMLDQQTLQGVSWSGETAMEEKTWKDYFSDKHAAPRPPLVAATAEGDLHLPLVKTSTATATKRLVEVSEDTYSLVVNGEPFYIKGIAYNPSHDWRDGFYPLTRPVLEADFHKIKALGANTIRRYSPRIYDYNLLQIAEEQELKVLYGFWFDPEVDYFRDVAQVKKYKREVIDRVKELKDRKAVLAWGVGNETWGLLKHHFRKTYLPTVRMAYLQMIEEIVAEIQEIDPARPVFSSLEHSEDLPMGLASYRDRVPSLDFISVNSYYEGQLKDLDSLCAAHYPDKPYLVSEFGPEGYWDPRFTAFNALEMPLEPSSYEKAASYHEDWTQYVLPHAGKNLGGVAFCWMDRMEETLTWFGLTDSKGRIRPAYYALKSAWAGQEEWSFPVPEVFLPQTQYPYEGFVLQGTMAEKSLSGLNVEWEVREDHILAPIEGIEYGAGSLRAWLPGDQLTHEKAYRVYLTLVDSTGTFSTSASLPIYYP
ncbi:MAG: glycosyltransferase [Bacteroidia bacterium]|nr:glycosyltransferase [Bacteroidia bacterium]